MRKVLTHAALASMLVLASSSARRVSTAAAFPSDNQADGQTIVHALNRLGFGPRPGDVAHVREIGLQRYLDLQLHPEAISDSSMDARLAGLTTTRMSPSQIAEEFERPQLEARRARQRQATQDPTGTVSQPTPPLAQQMQARANQVVLELGEQKLLRAIYSERQLQEVLADFWFNHFNVDARKGRDRFLLTEYERDAIRPHVLGSFRDLLGATAKSPAMLFYLDNWMSVDPNAAMRDGRRPVNRQKQGLNENYGRELMELHTLGVDGGYSQKDVTEVARAFTGWTITNPQQAAGYVFDARFHDRGEKLVLGHVIPAGGGESDGERVLDILATHPSTARFIATKLVRRFVSDTPPAALVDRVAARFLQTRGNLREVMRTIVTSPEFSSPDAYRAKIKTPFEFIVSAVRATGADVQDAVPLVRQMQQLGMPLYACQPPTGYKDSADAWVNTGALVNRMNLALALAGDRVRGTTVAVQPSGDGQAIVERLLNGDVSESTRATLAKASTPVQIAALTLGSPEFQRR